MNREVETGALVIDQFPAFQDDGYTKRSGLSVAGLDLLVTIFKDGVVDSSPVTIFEIGSTGDYRVSFTPVDDALFVIQVLIDFSKDIWAGYFHATTKSQEMEDDLTAIKRQTDKIDLYPTLGLNAVTTGSLMDRMCNANVEKSYNQAEDSLQGIRDRIR